MKHVRVLFLATIAVTTASPGYAQSPQQGWELSVHLLQMAARGNDVHVGDVYKYEDRLTGTTAASVETYGSTFAPIVTEMGSEWTGLGDIKYRGMTWNAGVQLWRLSTNGSATGTISSPASTSTFLGVYGVRMWDTSQGPVVNNLQASGYSPVDYHDANALEHMRLDAYVEHGWMDAGDLNLSWRLGLAGARIENTRSEGQSQVARTVTVASGTTTTFTNNITLDTTGEATMTLIGPVVSLAGGASLGRLQFDWLIGSSVMAGTSKLKGNFIDIDNIVTQQVGTVNATTTEVLHGEAPFSRDETVVVPSLDLQVKASTPVAPRLRVGLGLFSSTSFRLPMAPAFSVPGHWTILEGTGWKEQYRDISVVGVSAFGVFSF